MAKVVYIGSLQKTGKVTRMARIYGIILVLFVSLFALDVFDGTVSIWKEMAGLLIHLTPAYALAFACAIAWKRPAWGAGVYLLLAAALAYWSHFMFGTMIIAGLIVLAATLFILGRRLDKR